MEWATSDLDRFVLESDRLGGPGADACETFWMGFSVRHDCSVSDDLDPFSEDYVNKQMQLYEELSGRVYDSHANEQTMLDVAKHAAAANPYDHPQPATLALHIQRLSRAFRLGRPSRGDVLLDMGCGWGLSSEIAAYLGLTVQAIDINPSFVQLVNERAARSGASISAVTATFESFEVAEPVDLVLFYECLHHAVRPWVVIERVVASLKLGGRVILAGEPVNNAWWAHWGLRLDALSVYCIRKFGWFESGWSLQFITELLFRAGLNPEVSRDTDPAIDLTIVGIKGASSVSAQQAIDLFRGVGCYADGSHVMLAGSGSLSLCFPNGATEAVLHLINFRHRNLAVHMESNGSIVVEGQMLPGARDLILARATKPVELGFRVELWNPDLELGNGDTRNIGLHLSHVTFNYR